ncbi:unnamed protein product [Ixodes persulcatus]
MCNIADRVFCFFCTNTGMMMITMMMKEVGGASTSLSPSVLGSCRFVPLSPSNQSDQERCLHLGGFAPTSPRALISPGLMHCPPLPTRAGTRLGYAAHLPLGPLKFSANTFTIFSSMGHQARS